MNDSIQLQTFSILQVPFSKYENDFNFIVNDKEFHTSQIIADLLSPTISKMHMSDPTLREFTIKTKSSGDFQQILDLIDFKPHSISSNNIKYFTEVFEQLGTTKVDINCKFEEITLENVINKINEHENNVIYSKQYLKEIDFLSINFSTIFEHQKEELLKISEYSIQKILKNEKLILTNEDELLSFVNQLYTRNHQYGNLYEYVYFPNIETKTMEEFLSIFDDNDLTRETWKSISKRLMLEVVNENYFLNERYKLKWHIQFS